MISNSTTHKNKPCETTLDFTSDIHYHNPSAPVYKNAFVGTRYMQSNNNPNYTRRVMHGNGSRSNRNATQIAASYENSKFDTRGLKNRIRIPTACRPLMPRDCSVKIYKSKTTQRHAASTSWVRPVNIQNPIPEKWLDLKNFMDEYSSYSKFVLPMSNQNSQIIEKQPSESRFSIIKEDTEKSEKKSSDSIHVTSDSPFVVQSSSHLGATPQLNIADSNCSSTSSENIISKNKRNTKELSGSVDQPRSFQMDAQATRSFSNYTTVPSNMFQPQLRKQVSSSQMFLSPLHCSDPIRSHLGFHENTFSRTCSGTTSDDELTKETLKTTALEKSHVVKTEAKTKKSDSKIPRMSATRYSSSTDRFKTFNGVEQKNQGENNKKKQDIHEPNDSAHMQMIDSNECYSQIAIQNKVSSHQYSALEATASTLELSDQFQRHASSRSSFSDFGNESSNTTQQVITDEDYDESKIFPAEPPSPTPLEKKFSNSGYVMSKRNNSYSEKMPAEYTTPPNSEKSCSCQNVDEKPDTVNRVLYNNARISNSTTLFGSYFSESFADFSKEDYDETVPIKNSTSLSLDILVPVDMPVSTFDGLTENEVATRNNFSMTDVTSSYTGDNAENLARTSQSLNCLMTSNCFSTTSSSDNLPPFSITTETTSDISRILTTTKSPHIEQVPENIEFDSPIIQRRVTTINNNESVKISQSNDIKSSFEMSKCPKSFMDNIQKLKSQQEEMSEVHDSNQFLYSKKSNSETDILKVENNVPKKEASLYFDASKEKTITSNKQALKIFSNSEKQEHTGNLQHNNSEMAKIGSSTERKLDISGLSLIPQNVYVHQHSDITSLINGKPCVSLSTSNSPWLSNRDHAQVKGSYINIKTTCNDTNNYEKTSNIAAGETSFLREFQKNQYESVANNEMMQQATAKRWLRLGVPSSIHPSSNKIIDAMFQLNLTRLGIDVNTIVREELLRFGSVINTVHTSLDKNYTKKSTQLVRPVYMNKGGPMSSTTVVHKEISLHAINSGTFCTVFEGTYAGNSVAIKCPHLVHLTQDPEMMQRRSLLEWKILNRSRNHPNILQFRGAVVRSPIEIWLLTDFVRGGDLYSTLYTLVEGRQIQNIDALTPEARYNIMVQISNALSCIHGMQPKVVHKDLKTNNILIDTEGNIKLCDFGDAEEIPHGGHLECYTAVTWQYAPPEVFMSPDPSQPQGGANEAVDIWSFGCVLLELAYQPTPFWNILEYTDPSFHHSALQRHMLEIVKGKFSFDNIPSSCINQSNIPQPLGSLINQCLQLNPAERISAIQILQYLEKNKNLIIKSLFDVYASMKNPHVV